MKRFSKNSKTLIFSALAVLIVSLLIYRSLNTTEHFSFISWWGKIMKNRLIRWGNKLNPKAPFKAQYYIDNGHKSKHWCDYAHNRQFCTKHNFENKKNYEKKNHKVLSKHPKDSSIDKEHIIRIIPSEWDKTADPSRDNCGHDKKGKLYVYKEGYYDFEYEKIPENNGWKCILKQDEKYAKNRNPYNEYLAYEALRKSPFVTFHGKPRNTHGIIFG